MNLVFALFLIAIFAATFPGLDAFAVVRPAIIRKNPLTTRTYSCKMIPNPISSMILSEEIIEDLDAMQQSAVQATTTALQKNNLAILDSKCLKF